MVYKTDHIVKGSFQAPLSMAGWRWYLLISKEAVVIILWYAIHALCYASLKSFVISNKKNVLVVLISTTIL